MPAKPRDKTRAAARKAAARDVPKFLMSGACTDGEPMVLAAAGTGEDAGPRKWSAVVYTGGKMRPQGFAFPVVAELSGIRVMAGDRPALFIHDQRRPVGHATQVTVKQSLRAEGILSVDGEDARMIAASFDNGFPWKTSMGVLMEDLRFFDSQETFQANGRTWRGPCYYLAKCQLFEISFVTVAGDNTSSATIAASLGGLNQESPMKFQDWLQANFGDAEFTDEQLTLLKASFEAQQQHPTPGAAGGNGNGNGNGGGAPTPGAGNPLTAAGTQVDVAAQVRQMLASGQQDFLAEMRTSAAAELQRQATISTLCASHGNPSIRVDAAGNPVADGGREVTLQAHAVAMNWSTENVELQCLRASRGGAPAIHSGSGGGIDANVLEAACRLTIGGVNTEERLLAEYGEQTLTAAGALRNIGMRDATRIACEIEGRRIPAYFGDGRETLRAAFTTQTLPYVFENVMNKTLLLMIAALTSVARRICKISRTSDFKQVSRVNLFASGAWEQVGPDGELKHGTVSDSKYTNQLSTFGQFLMLTRQDWINDDLGALESLSKYMAIMGEQVVEDAFFTLLLANTANFFHANNANVGTGVFNAANLSALKTVFRKQKQGPGSKTTDKRPVNIQPAKLLVPVELEDDANMLIGSANLMMENRDTTADTPSKTAPKNPHYGKYEVLSAPQLSDAAFTGYSPVMYYLFANPEVVAAFDLMFLNGVQRPTIERVEARPDQLGMGFRGYIDFGYGQENPQAAARSTGA